MRNLVPRQRESLLANKLRQPCLDREAGLLALLVVAWALRKQPREVVLERLEALAAQGAHRMEGLKVTEGGGRLDLLRDPVGLQAVDLVQSDHDGRPGCEDSLRDETVAGADAFIRGEHEQEAVDVLEGGVDRPLHPLCEGVPGSLKPRQVGEDELVVVCGLSETMATFSRASAFTRVDFPTFGRPVTATNPLLTTGRSREGARRDGERAAPPRA